MRFRSITASFGRIDIPLVKAAARTTDEIGRIKADLRIAAERLRRNQLIKCLTPIMPPTRKQKRSSPFLDWTNAYFHIQYKFNSECSHD
jgi:hypothetical protein